MPHKNTYSEILLHSNDYLAEIAQKIKSRNQAADALKQAQKSLLSAVETQKDSIFIQNRYERLYGLLEILEDVPKRELLQKFLTQIYEISKEPYDPDPHFENIKSYKQIGILFGQDLISELISKFQSHIKKEVKFLQMKEKSYIGNEVCDFAIGSIQNLSTTPEEPTEQQTYEIVLLYEIFNFRLSTLNEEQAWDFMAQSILEQTTIKP